MRFGVLAPLSKCHRLYPKWLRSASSADTDFMPAKIDARPHHQFPGSPSSVPRKVSMRASSMLHPRRRVAKSYPRDFANPTQCDIYSGKNDHKDMLIASIFSRRQSPCIAAQADVSGRNSLREVAIAAQAEAAYVPGRNSLREVDGETATVLMPLGRGKPWFEPRRHGE